MNLPTFSDSSLYQLAQGIDPSLLSLTVSTSTFKTVVGAMMDLLIEQQIPAIVWIKLPFQAEWITLIERYQEQGQAQKIYWCSTRKENLFFCNYNGH